MTIRDKKTGRFVKRSEMGLSGKYPRTPYYGSVKADKVWIGEKSVGIKLDKEKARKLAQSINRGLKDGKDRIILSLHIPYGHITTTSR